MDHKNAIAAPQLSDCFKRLVGKPAGRVDPYARYALDPFDASRSVHTFPNQPIQQAARR
jgi:hypothetical protein